MSKVGLVSISLATSHLSSISRPGVADMNAPACPTPGCFLCSQQPPPANTIATSSSPPPLPPHQSAVPHLPPLHLSHYGAESAEITELKSRLHWISCGEIGKFYDQNGTGEWDYFCYGQRSARAEGKPANALASHACGREIWGGCGSGEVRAGGGESAGAVYEGRVGEDAGVVGGGGGVSGTGEEEGDEEDRVECGAYWACAECGCFDVRVVGCGYGAFEGVKTGGEHVGLERLMCYG